MVKLACFISFIEPTSVSEAFDDEFWTYAMHQEMDHFVRLDVGNIVPKLKHVNVVGTKWVFKNKIDEDGNFIRKKAKMVTQGYSQIEGVNLDETFAHVARLGINTFAIWYNL